jgi:hypothetical protein
MVGKISLVALLAVALHAPAEAQARGTLQASAVVVSAAPALDAQIAVNQVVGRNWQHNVTTLATISVVQREPVSRRPAVVTVEFARN